MLNLACKTWMNVAQVRTAVREAGLPRVAECAHMVETEAKRSMHGGGKKHVPSPPGQPPHVQSGALRASIQVEGPTDRGTYLVGPTVWYGKLHEFGCVTKKGRHIPPRPFMRPARDRVMRGFPRMFAQLPLAMTQAGASLNSLSGGAK